METSNERLTSAESENSVLPRAKAVISQVPAATKVTTSPLIVQTRDFAMKEIGKGDELLAYCEIENGASETVLRTPLKSWKVTRCSRRVSPGELPPPKPPPEPLATRKVGDPWVIS